MSLHIVSLDTPIEDTVIIEMNTQINIPMSVHISALASASANEIDKYRRGEPHTDHYCLELFRYALIQRNAYAWEMLQQCLNETMLRWMRCHSMYNTACRHDSEENYIAQAFARFWIATTNRQGVEFHTLAAALCYLRASLNGTILDTLRMYSRPKEISLPALDISGEPSMEDPDEGNETWEIVKSFLPEPQEQRVAYLLFHCGLKAREIVQHCSNEFSDVYEIYRLRRNIIDRLTRNADLLHWKLGDGTARIS